MGCCSWGLASPKQPGAAAGRLGKLQGMIFCNETRSEMAMSLTFYLCLFFFSPLEGGGWG